ESLRHDRILGERLAQQFDGDRPAQQLVGCSPHLAHAARCDPVLEPVAAAQHDAGLTPAAASPTRPTHFSASRASMSAFAIGPATLPPVASPPRSPPFSTTTATAMCGA